MRTRTGWRRARRDFARTSWLAVWSAGAAALVIGGCGQVPGDEDEGAGAAGPIKVGLLAPASGTAAAPGKDMVNGWKLYFKVNGDTVAGRKLETIYEDTASEPSAALTKARKLTQQDGAKLLVGPLLSSSAYAVANYLKGQSDVIGLNPVAGVDDLSQRKRIDNYIRAAGWHASAQTHVVGDWAYEKGWRNVVTICHDYAFGYENCGGFVNTFTDRGGKIIKQLWPPLGTSDFSSFLAQVPKSADGVFVALCCADSARFLKAWTDLGLKGTVPLVGTESTLGQEVLRGLTSDDVVGMTSFGHFAEGREDPATSDFVTAYEREYGSLPSTYACATYAAAQWLATAIKTANGDLSDSVRFRGIVNTTSIDDSCLGPMHLEEHGGVVANVYERKVAKRQGKLLNEVVKTFPEVNQFWRYEPEAFLGQPVYSRSYQGADWPGSCAAFASECPLK